jgi:hypothetical protein
VAVSSVYLKQMILMLHQRKKMMRKMKIWNDLIKYSEILFTVILVLSTYKETRLYIAFPTSDIP